MFLEGARSVFSGFRPADETIDFSNRVSLDQLLKENQPLPEGVELHWQSEFRPEVSTALSDFDYFENTWQDVRATPDVSLLPPEAIFRFTNVKINGLGGVWLNDGRVIHSPWLGARANAWPKEGTLRQVGSIKKPAITVAFGANGFGHWFLHRLSRLAVIPEHGKNRHIISTKLFWNPRFMWEGFGIDPDSPQFLTKDKNVYLRAKDILLPTYSTPLFFPRVTDAARMRRDVEAISRGIGGQRGDGFGPEKIFFPRGSTKATRTGISDPERLEQVFVKRGFVPVVLSQMSFHDQIRTIRSAKVIAGEVGSFSMNAIFAEPGLGVITVAAKNRLNHLRYFPGMKTYTRTVTDAFGHHQRRIVASEEHRTAPWYADFDLIEEALETMPEIP